MLVLTSCHYRFGYGDLPERYTTISIPYVKGDDDGSLTAAVIRQVSTSGGLRYVSHGGDLTLHIELIEVRDENIGFRYDRNKQGCRKKGIIPTETRLIALAEVSILETKSHKIIRGPTRVVTSVDFDHDYYYSRHRINIFSLGQLSDIDAAQEVAMQPLNRRLAEKIADFVINSW
jgi:hypothetical protein